MNPKLFLCKVVFTNVPNYLFNVTFLFAYKYRYQTPLNEIELTAGNECMCTSSFMNKNSFYKWQCGINFDKN